MWKSTDLISAEPWLWSETILPKWVSEVKTVIYLKSVIKSRNKKKPLPLNTKIALVSEQYTRQLPDHLSMMTSVLKKEFKGTAVVSCFCGGKGSWYKTDNYFWPFLIQLNLLYPQKKCYEIKWNSRK